MKHKKKIIGVAALGTAGYLWLSSRLGIKVTTISNDRRLLDYDVKIGLKTFKGRINAREKQSIREQHKGKVLRIGTSNGDMVTFSITGKDNKVLKHHEHIFPPIGIIPEGTAVKRYQ